MKFPRSITTLLALSMFISVTSSVAAQEADSTGKAVFLNSSDLRWENAPASMPKGAKVSVLLGDPGKTGPFVIRLKAPAGYKIPLHFHSRDETLTIISGTLYLGHGEKFDPAKAHALKAGGFHYLPAKTTHFAFTKVQTIIEIHGNGPFDLIAEDDAQKAGEK